MPDETTRADDRRAWTDEMYRETLRETDGHGTKENKVGVCMIVKEVVLSLQGVDQRSAIKATPFINCTGTQRRSLVALKTLQL
jgi:hypothetical protein